MKKLFILFSFMFCVSGWGQDDLSYLSDFAPITNEVRIDLLDSAKQKAIEILNFVATEYYSPQLRSNANILIGLLRTVHFKEPKGPRALSKCSDGTAAFVVSLVPNFIHLCNNSIESAHKTTKIAQLLIHESVHLANDFNECSATKFELKIMKRSKEGIQFLNSYVSSCSINIKDL